MTGVEKTVKVKIDVMMTKEWILFDLSLGQKWKKGMKKKDYGAASETIVQWKLKEMMMEVGDWKKTMMMKEKLAVWMKIGMFVSSAIEDVHTSAEVALGQAGQTVM